MKDPNEFIADFSVQGMFYAQTVRSPITRGTLKEIVLPKLPASFYLITAEHIPGENFLAEGNSGQSIRRTSEEFPVQVLADKNLSYIGQPIAILVGPEKPRLEELFSQIKIITEEDPSECSQLPANVIVSRNIEQGQQAQVDNKRTVSGVYTTGIQEHWYAEPHGALVVPSFLPISNQHEGLEESSFPSVGTGENEAGKDDNGKNKTEALTVYTATQWPFHVKHSIMRLLGLDNVTVTPTLMTQHLDGKIWYPSLVACHAALAAWICKRPVKLMLKRQEDFMYSPKRNAAEIEIHSDLGEKGEILGTEVSVKLDFGAGEILSNEIMDQTCLGALGIYRHHAVKVNGIGLSTNIPPQGPMAGFGFSQGCFAAERHISRIADTLGQDPAEWRKNNSLRKDSPAIDTGTPSQKNMSFAIGTVLKNQVPIPELIDIAASMSDYYRKWASYELLRSRRVGEKFTLSEPLRGIGIATACQGNGFLNNGEINGGNCTVEITLEKEGFLEIKTSFASSGAWHLSNWQKLAEEILGVDPALVMLTGNTARAPDSGPGTLSRTAVIASKLVERCLMAIRKQRFRDPLPITVKRSDIAVKAPGWVPNRLIDTEAFARPGWGAAIAEIEIDPVSFQPIVRGIWLAVDGGKLLNEKRALRTLKTAAIHALGWTCKEHLGYVDGKIPAEYHRGYNIPAPEEIPPIEVSFLRTDTSVYKGVGDLPFSCVPAA